jgi:hypothetical protein
MMEATLVPTVEVVKEAVWPSGSQIGSGSYRTRVGGSRARSYGSLNCRGQPFFSPSSVNPETISAHLLSLSPSQSVGFTGAMAWTLMSLVEVRRQNDGVVICQTVWRRPYRYHGSVLTTQIEALMTGPVRRLGLFLFFYFD